MDSNLGASPRLGGVTVLDHAFQQHQHHHQQEQHQLSFQTFVPQRPPILIIVCLIMHIAFHDQLPVINPQGHQQNCTLIETNLNWQMLIWASAQFTCHDPCWKRYNKYSIAKFIFQTCSAHTVVLMTLILTLTTAVGRWFQGRSLLGLRMVNCILHFCQHSLK